ncbi:MAG TPA: hypothetical protein VH186_26720 [Chloroflexia bacterium]|nr:hypothetical protein [Chloroflexia bacterium]
MLDFKATSLNITKASFTLAGWGLLLLLAGCINQWFELKTDFVLLLWVGVTVLGVLAQLAGMANGLGLNLLAWLFVIAAGWVFTYYVTKFENGVHADLYGDLAGVWLILLGIGYVACIFQLDRRFALIAALHFVAGALLELSARGIVSLEFLDSYSSLVFGLVAGVPLLVAALPFWYAEAQPEPQSQSQPAVYHPETNFPETNY